GSFPGPELGRWYCGNPEAHPGTDPPRASAHLMAAEVDELITRSRHAVVVGVGNVAIDVARVLIKSFVQLTYTDMPKEVLECLSRNGITDVHVLGRRGPAYTSFTTKELRELGEIDDVDVIVDSLDLH